MATVTCPAPARTVSRNDLAREFLVEMGYDRATAAAALADPSLVSPADAASVGRILDVARTVDVKGVGYQIEPLPSPDGPAYRLTSPKGKVYDVQDGQYGAECDCPDFVCRRAGLDAAGCKHVKALVAAGLVANAHAHAPLISNEPGVEAPAALPTFSDDADVEAAIHEARACLWPCSDRYKADMGHLADRADRVAALMAEPLPPADPWDREYARAADWPADTDADRWTTTEAPVPAPSEADPAAVAAAFEASWLADLADPGSMLYAAKLPARPAADARPVRLRTPRRTNVGSEYRDEDQLAAHGCV